VQDDLTFWVGDGPPKNGPIIDERMEFTVLPAWVNAKGQIGQELPVEFTADKTSSAGDQNFPG